MNEVMRAEKKYLISLDEYKKHSFFLENFLEKDKHNMQNGYCVRSLYFDSLDDRDFEEKEDGLEIRRKIRLRIYNPSSDVALLEMKQKQGDNQLKRSLQMKREDAMRLTEGEYHILLSYPESFAAECYGIMNMHCYRPKTIVEYDRMAFLAKENRIRITYDQNIRATESNYQIFQETLPLNPVMDAYNVILEVKYNGFLLSYMKDALGLADKNQLSVSKYILARNVSKG